MKKAEKKLVETGWMVITPNKKTIGSLWGTKGGAIGIFTHSYSRFRPGINKDDSWKLDEEQGYRCVKVIIREQ